MQNSLLAGNILPAFINNPTALMVVVVVILLFFGGKNIPEMMKGLGQGMREFKKGMEQDDAPHPVADAEKEARIRAEIEKEVRARLEAERQIIPSTHENDTLEQRHRK